MNNFRNRWYSPSMGRFISSVLGVDDYVDFGTESETVISYEEVCDSCD